VLRLVFVYGSLLSGEVNHERLAGARYLGDARTEPAFELVDLGPYPALVRGGATSVVGELYGVPTALLVELDTFEEHPHIYRRAPICLDDGRRAHAYLFPSALAATHPRIPSGSWRARSAGLVLLAAGG
jgi:gamma-glutamylcyclotransferase (GGCT)/AIG2-like uncharacterized protein YtfP